MLRAIGPAVEQVPRVMSATVVEVYASEGLVSVTTQSPSLRTYERIPYASAYLSPNGGGIDFCPERGASCWILTNPSDPLSGGDEETCVISFRSRTRETQTIRQGLVPGDIRVAGSYGNELLLKRNGDIYLLSETNCGVAYLSSKDLVKAVSPNYEHLLAGGSFRWNVLSEELGGPVSAVLEVKKYSSDETPYLTVTAGAEAGGGLRLELFSGIGAGPDETVLIAAVQKDLNALVDITEEGKLFGWFRDGIDLRTDGPVNVTTQSSIGLTSPSVQINNAVSVSSTGQVLIGANGSGIEISPEGLVTIRAPLGVLVDGPSLNVFAGETGLSAITPDDEDPSFEDEEGQVKKLATVDLVQLFLEHRHVTYPVGALTQPAATTSPISVAEPGTDGIVIASAAQSLAPTPALVLERQQVVVDSVELSTKNTIAR